MSWKGNRPSDDDVDDFDDYDPTPYGGGYSLDQTYGRALEASVEICYPITSSSVSGDFDYDRSRYTSYAVPSAYNDDALDYEYKSYARPKPRPDPSYVTHPSEEVVYGGGEDEGPKPNYSFHPGKHRPGGYDEESEYGRNQYGSGGAGSEFHREPSSEYGRTECVDQTAEYDSGYGRTSKYEQPTSDYGSGYQKQPTYSEESGGGGYGYGIRPHRAEVVQKSGSYGKSSYGRTEQKDYSRSSYGKHHDDDDNKGYSRQKSGDEDSDDEEKKKHRHKHHHHHKY